MIEDIKEEKKKNIKTNIKYLEELSNTLQGSIDNLKIIFENIIQNKEELKLSIQKTFTKIRNELNNREDELLLQVDKQFNENYCDEIILKQCEKLPNKVKISLEKGKSIELNDDKLALFVNECINIEKNIKDINNINDSIKKMKNDADVDILFFSDEKLILENIKTFGKILLGINNIESAIIKEDKEKQEIIINWIKQKKNKNRIKFEKIFVMSVNGSSSQDFHKYCDNKGPTLTIIKTTKNRIFGGFTPLNWETGEDEEFNYIKKIDKDNKTFIFSLNLMKKYDMINKDKVAIYCGRSYGPYFGGGDFSVESNMKEGETYANARTLLQGSNFLSNLELTGGKGKNESFEIEDFEVFKVIY